MSEYHTGLIHPQQPMPSRIHHPLKPASGLAVTISLVLALASSPARAQTTVTLDATSGSNSISTSYTLSGDTTFDLEFVTEYLIVGGGGGGGSATTYSAGGGGGGQVVAGTTSIGGGLNYSGPVVVGNGGNGATSVVTGGSGGTSSWNSITALGGGGGGSGDGNRSQAAPSGSPAFTGGGGGGSYNGTASNGAAGTAFSGGNGQYNNSSSSLQGGGGGAGAGGNGTGGSGTSAEGSEVFVGNGGIGVSSSITGTSLGYGGGGGGGKRAGTAGSGVDGGGSGATNGDGSNGTANRGGGGGGAGGNGNGGNGGSGVVILRYAGDDTGITGGSTDTSTVSGEAITTFTGSGTFAIDLNARLGATLTTGIGGTGNLTYSGPGRLSLAADSSYTGNTTLSAGTLQVGSGGTAGTLGSGEIAIAAGATLAYDRSDAVIESNALSGTGTLLQKGGDRLTLTADNPSFAGTATIASGTLKIGNGGSTGSLGTASVTNNSALVVDRTGSLTIGGAISGSGTFEQAGSGTTILTGANSYAGTTSVTAGTLEVGAGGTSGTLGSGSVTNDAALVFNRSDDLAVSNTIAGSGSLTQEGTGQVVLSGNNSFSGGTTVTSGVVIAGSDTALGTGSVTLSGGRLLANPGVTLANPITLSAAAASMRLGSEVNLAVDYLVVGGGGGGGAADQAFSAGGGGGGEVVSGTTLAALSAEDVAVVVGEGGDGSTTLAAAGAIGGTSSFGGVSALGGGGGASGGAPGGATSASNATTGYTGGGGGGSYFNDNNYELGASGNGGGAGGDGRIDGQSGEGQLAGGGGGAGGDGGNGVNGSPPTSGAGGVGVTSSITGSSMAYGGGGGGGKRQDGAAGLGTDGGGNGGLVAGGANGTANTGGGGGGAGSSGDGGSGGSGVVIVRYAGSPVATGGRIDTTSVPGDTIHFFETTGSSALAADPSLIRATLSGDLSGTGGFTLDTPSTLVLTGTNSYQGETIVSAGVLQVGNKTTTGSLGSGTVINNAALVFDRSNALSAANAISGTGSLTQQGTGTLTLTGDNSYIGATKISDGTLQVGTGGTDGTLGGTGAIANDGTLVFNRSDAVTLDRAVTGTGSLSHAGSGTLTLSGANTYSGGTTVAAGRLVGDSSSLQGDIANEATVEFNQAADGTYAGVLSGSGAVELAGGGTLTLTGANTYSGGTTVAAGRLVGDSSSLQGDIANEATVEFNQAADGTYAGVLSGSGAVELASGGTLTLTGTNSYTGATTISDGTLQVGDGGTDGTLGGTGAIANNGTLAFNRSDAVTLDRAVTGTGALSHAGSGTLTLTGNNSYTGPTTISDGTVQVGAGGTTGSLGGGSVSVAAGASLAFDRSDALLSVANAISGSGSITQAGSGLTTLSGANTFSGGTTISAGTLAVAAIADSGTSNFGTSGTLTLAGGTLEYTAATAATTARLVDISNANTTSTINVSDAAGQLTLTGFVRNTDPTHPNVVLNKTGSGTLEIGGAGNNTSTSLVATAGTTVLNATERAVYEIRALDAGATVRLAQADQVFNGDAISTTGNIRMTGGTLDLDGNDQQIFRLIGSDNATAGTGTITSSTAATFTVGNNLSGRPSIFDGSLTGDLALVTRGSNTVTLTGTNTYTGGTTVAAGRLVGDTTSLQGDIANEATVEFNQAAAGTYAGVLSGSGAVEVAGGGTLTLTGANTYTGDTTVAAGELRVDGSIASSAVSLASGAALWGSGRVGAISGAGSVNPGQSPGILTATSVDLSSGLDFNFEFTQFTPDYGAPTASGNDVLHLTDSTPFLGNFSGSNTVNVYLNVAEDPIPDDSYLGGFFSEVDPAEVSIAFSEAVFNYYLADANGPVAYDGTNYRAYDGEYTFHPGWAAQSAQFAGSAQAIDGFSLELTTVPEPQSSAFLLGVAAGLLVLLRRRRARSP